MVARKHGSVKYRKNHIVSRGVILKRIPLDDSVFLHMPKFLILGKLSEHTAVFSVMTIQDHIGICAPIRIFYIGKDGPLFAFCLPEVMVQIVLVIPIYHRLIDQITNLEPADQIVVGFPKVFETIWEFACLCIENRFGFCTGNQ